MTSATTPPQERLLNLVIGLASATRPVTRAQILETFVGYQDSKSPSAFERLFERDKEILRRLGIPLITAPTSSFEDEVGYLIDAKNYALDPIDFTPAQARIATLAATLWRDSAMQDAAARGVTKLRAIGASMSGLQPPAVDIDAGATTPAFNALLAAIRGRRQVTFTYRAASNGEERKRSVQPWRISGRRGVWYLTGFDLGRGASRIFRLDRITDAVRALGPENAYEIPEDVQKNLQPTAPESLNARILVAAGRANVLRMRADKTTSLSEVSLDGFPEAISRDWEGADLLEFTVANADELARAVAGLGEHALVLEPAQLREHVTRLLRGVVGIPAAEGSADGRD